ncbi:MAG: hypothetical protein HPY83_05385 [Anaerolineae bacterium]|nr:hypothetical protein [Anaerolineae bacterium]
MNPGDRDERRPAPDEQEEERLSRTVGRKAERRLRARTEREGTIWFGLGMYGLVGWSVAIPTLIGIAIGLLLDALFPGDLSWTLIMLLLGLVAGLLNAWRWIAQELPNHRRQRKRPED